MKKLAFTTAVLLIAVAMNACTTSSSPQQLTMTAGASANVGGGRAKMWFAQPTEVYADGRIASAAAVSLTCQGKETGVTLLLGKPSEEVCGVRVKLLSITEPGPQSPVFKGVFEVTWS